MKMKTGCILVRDGFYVSYCFCFHAGGYDFGNHTNTLKHFVYLSDFSLGSSLLRGSDLSTQYK